MSKTNGKRNGKPDLQAKAGKDGRTITGQFLPGVSGNPRGGQRGYLTIARESLQAILDQKISAKNKRTRLDTFWEDVLSHSAKGNAGAMRLIAERIYPATLQIDANVTGMAATQTLAVFDCMAADYVKAGRLPDLSDRG